MDFLNFGLQQLKNGSLNNMLEQVGVDDVGSFVNQFRNQAQASTGNTASGKNPTDMIQGAMNAYKTFSGGQSGGSGNILDDIGSTYQNAQQMYAMYKKFDRNGDGKITADDIQIYLQELGVGGVSPYLAKALFQAVDQNHNGTLDFTDLMALTALINKLYGQYSGGGGAVAEE